MITKKLLAISTIPMLGLGIFMVTNIPKAESDTDVQRQEFSVVEQKVNLTETKVAEIDTKVEEVKTTQAQHTEEIKKVKAKLQEVKTVYVETPAPVVAPIKVVEIDYCKELQQFIIANNLPIHSSNKKEGWCSFSFTSKDEKGNQIGNYGIQYSKEKNKFASSIDNKFTTENLNLNFEQAKAFILSVK